MNEFLVVKSYIRSRLLPDQNGVRYDKVTAKPATSGNKPYELHYLEISRETAKELVHKHAMVRTVKNEHGTIWDTGLFQETYKGLVTIGE